MVEEKVKLEQEKTDNDRKIMQYEQELKTAAEEIHSQNMKVTDA